MVSYGSAEMKCPVCAATDLMMSKRSGIGIDYCPQYRGVWLDRGELDKIIERSIPQLGIESVQQQDSVHQKSNHHWGGADHHHDRRGHEGHGHSYHGKKSFRQEIFD
jgi:Zn-finger nucleic acid-binding protein